MQRGGTPRDPRERGRNLIGQFPGPVFLAAQPDPEWLTDWGATATDAGPRSAHIRYRSASRILVLSVRTVLPEPVPPPTIGSVEGYMSALVEVRGAARRGRRPSLRGKLRPDNGDEVRAWLAAARREEAETPERPCTARIDETEVAGHRKDFSDCSVAIFPWPDGRRILCAGQSSAIDRLQLRSAPALPQSQSPSHGG